MRCNTWILLLLLTVVLFWRHGLAAQSQMELLKRTQKEWVMVSGSSPGGSAEPARPVLLPAASWCWNETPQHLPVHMLKISVTQTKHCQQLLYCRAELHCQSHWWYSLFTLAIIGIGVAYFIHSKVPCAACKEWHVIFPPETWFLTLSSPGYETGKLAVLHTINSMCWLWWFMDSYWCVSNKWPQNKTTLQFPARLPLHPFTSQCSRENVCTFRCRSNIKRALGRGWAIGPSIPIVLPDNPLNLTVSLFLFALGATFSKPTFFQTNEWNHSWRLQVDSICIKDLSYFLTS